MKLKFYEKSAIKKINLNYQPLNFGRFFLCFIASLIPVIWFFFGNYAKREILVIIKPKQELFSKPLTSAQKTIKKAKKKTT